MSPSFKLSFDLSDFEGLNPLGASVIALDNDTVRRRSSFIRRHLFIPAGMITMGKLSLEHIRATRQEGPRPPSSPFSTGSR
jgi:hypothetical protein